MISVWLFLPVRVVTLSRVFSNRNHAPESTRVVVFVVVIFIIGVFVVFQEAHEGGKQASRETGSAGTIVVFIAFIVASEAEGASDSHSSDSHSSDSHSRTTQEAHEGGKQASRENWQTSFLTPVLNRGASYECAVTGAPLRRPWRPPLRARLRRGSWRN